MLNTTLTALEINELTMEQYETAVESGEYNENALYFVPEDSENIGNTNTIVLSNVAVPSSAWIADATYTDYPFKADIAAANCTADRIPEVIFGLAEAVGGKLAPVAATSDGKVTIYSKEELEDITIPTIVLTKAVSV